jgi:hypothetical protein
MKVRHKYVKGATGATVNRTNWNDDHDITDVAIADIPGLQSALDGKEASGTANAAIVAHRNETDPHTQYTTIAEASAAAPVQSVAGQAGAITASALKAALGITTSDVSGNLDGSRITGTIPISAMPAGALDRLVIVANQAARYALTVATVQTGDTVKDNDTGLLWFVVDDTKLDQPAGYSAYTAGQASSVPWSGVTGLPTALQAGGTAGQYVAGNMTLQTLNAAAVGLGSVNNTSDANKPVSTAQQAALDTKAPLANPSFTGGISTPAINGGGSSGFKNKIINGCMRISKKGNGSAALGPNNFGADGLTTIIGGWSAITGSISRETGVTDARTSSGSIHYTSLSSATGSSGYIIHQYKIEAADAQEIGGKTVTVSARVSAITKAADSTYIRVHKAGALNDFASPVLVSTGGSVNVPATNTGTPVSHTFALSAADAQNGIVVEVVCGYTTAVASSLICLIADVMCSAATGVDVFEPRQIAIEELLRQRYYRKQSIRVNTSSNWTCFPIGMVKTPTITGGGTGFTSTGTTADTLMCYQTTAAAQTLTLDAEL